MSWIANMFGSPFGSPLAQTPLDPLPFGNPPLPGGPNRMPDTTPPYAPPAADRGGYGYGWQNGFGGDGGFGGILGGFFNYISNLFAAISGWFANQWGSSNPGQPPPTSKERFFTSADASSWGDPHDTFNATGPGGAVSNHWDDMTAQTDLLNSDSFAGGFRISTTVTTPGANGATLNASATVTTDGGANSVTLDANGTVSVVESGRNVTLAPGQSISVGGETVTDNGKSVTLVDQNGRGGSLTTTLTSNGYGGVDVTAHGSNVDLGGYLVDRNAAPQTGAPVAGAPTAGTPRPFTLPPGFALPPTGSPPAHAWRPSTTPSTIDPEPNLDPIL